MGLSLLLHIFDNIRNKWHHFLGVNLLQVLRRFFCFFDKLINLDDFWFGSRDSFLNLIGGLLLIDCQDHLFLLIDVSLQPFTVVLLQLRTDGQVIEAFIDDLLSVLEGRNEIVHLKWFFIV